ncbi:hypothetical protein, partial [Vibrio sp. Sgm 5]|uniref:hypothetical protein n=1 Tax=Vibrio sp. Sgm 5 TaxID=2994387 RepID=UPI0022494EC9
FSVTNQQSIQSGKRKMPVSLTDWHYSTRRAFLILLSANNTKLNSKHPNSSFWGLQGFQSLILCASTTERWLSG